MPAKSQGHPVPCATTVSRLSTHRDRMVTRLMRTIDEEHPWYRSLSADERSWIGLVAQSSIDAFIAWCKDRNRTAPSPQEVFSVAPTEMTRTVSLHQTLMLLKCGVDVIEAEAEVISAPGRAHELHEALLRYSSEFAFVTAEVYARAAELRGSWDARLEAHVLDALMRGEVGPDVHSRVAALGWSAEGRTVAIATEVDAPLRESRLREIRHAALAAAPDSLAGFLHKRIIVLLNGLDDYSSAPSQLDGALGDGPVVMGPMVTSLDDVPRSIRAAARGLDAVGAWAAAPKWVQADELLVERLMIGDPDAKTTLLKDLYEPIVRGGKDAILTLTTYLELGRSLEGAARQLFVHPNTVRYRLSKIAAACGWDPTNPREGYVLQHALGIGRLESLKTKS